MHNKEEITADALFELLDSIAQFIEQDVSMYALGGTALTILNLKRSTLDVDVNIASKREYDYLCNVFEQIGFEKTGIIRWRSQEGIAFDLFHGSYILGTDLLPDCLELSKFIKSFGKIRLYTLSLYDIIISKLARGDERDFEDIKKILEKEEIDINDLVERYRKTMEVSEVNEYRQKLLDLIEIKFKEWGHKIDRELIDKVRKWE